MVPPRKGAAKLQPTIRQRSSRKLDHRAHLAPRYPGPRTKRARLGPGVGARPVHHGHAVHEDVADARGQLVRPFEEVA